MAAQGSIRKAKRGFVTARRRARRVALQILYEVDAVGHPLDEVSKRHMRGKRLPKEAASFARDLVEGVISNTARLDAVIAKFAPTWPVAQLLVVDRSLLRLAIYEITIERATPPRVVINETVELAKTFGSESSFRFVNGVLGSVLEAATP